LAGQREGKDRESSKALGKPKDASRTLAVKTLGGGRGLDRTGGLRRREKNLLEMLGYRLSRGAGARG